MDTILLISGLRLMLSACWLASLVLVVGLLKVVLQLGEGALQDLASLGKHSKFLRHQKK